MKRLDIFKPAGSNEQSRFWDTLEELLDALAAENIPPSQVHSVIHNTRTWMALVIIEEEDYEPCSKS